VKLSSTVSENLDQASSSELMVRVDRIIYLCLFWINAASGVTWVGVTRGDN